MLVVLLFQRPVFLTTTSEIGDALQILDVKIIAMLNEKVCIALPGIPTPGSAKKAFNYTQRWGKRWGRGVVCHNCFSPNPCQLTQAAITLEVAVSRLRKAPLRRVGRRAGAN